MNAVAELPEAETAPARAVREIRPQPGPQEAFLACSCDIAIIGGGAFGGKTWALLYEDVRHIHDPMFASITFRRTTPQITNSGGLWDEVKLMFAGMGCRPLSSPQHQLVFPSGAVAKFAHLEREDTVHGYDGAQIPVIKFDQLEHFEASQFWYMLSRNRDPSGHVKPYIRATCNPQPDSWLGIGGLLDWWIDSKTGYAIPERSGVPRWFVREGETMHWADTREELVRQFWKPGLPEDHPDQARPLSITFIVALISDNQIGLAKDPGYIAKLKAMPRHERERLLGDVKLGGNWKVRASAGMLFQRDWCTMLPAEPEDVEWVRGWDRAATKPSSTNPDPDWTVGVRLGKYRGRSRFVIAPDVKRMREGPSKVDESIKNTAVADGPKCRIRVPQDPGQAGKAQAKATVAMLAGYSVRCDPVTGDKVVRFSPFSSQAEAGNVDLVAGVPEAFLVSLEAFPDALHDDDADAVSEAFAGHHSSGAQNILEAMRRQSEEVKAALEAQVKADAEAPGAPTVATHDVRHEAHRGPEGARTVRELVAARKPQKPQREKTVGELEAERAAAHKGNGAKHSSFTEATAKGDWE